MRTKHEIISDPQASAEEVLSLSREDMLNHPNCPHGHWWLAAQESPLTALQSPAYALLILEEPGRWEAMESELVEAWINQTIRATTWDKRQLFAADCLEHVLPLFEARVPHDNRVKTAIEVRRKWARFEYPNNQEWERASKNAAALLQEGLEDPTTIFIVEAASEEEVIDVVTTLVSAVSWSAQPRTAQQAKNDELRWQWRCLLGYWLGTVR